jgi:phenylpropionate dioxygenase-like ring-hydroxylating dioxygenase large terminal subunit
MDRATQARLAARIRELRRARSTDLAPSTYRVPGADYTSEAGLAAELMALFLHGPLLAGLSGEARAPGDWFSFEACGRSAVAWRQTDGTLRAFVNACRHRGMRVATGCGRGERTLVCPYHSWTYDRDGRVVAIPG